MCIRVDYSGCECVSSKHMFETPNCLVVILMSKELFNGFLTSEANIMVLYVSVDTGYDYFCGGWTDFELFLV